ncbi:MAG TPA: hypothetical protein VFZ46_07065, partial [Nitrososphaeraceae archaeon]
MNIIKNTLKLILQIHNESKTTITTTNKYNNITSITSILVLSTIFALLYLLDNYQYAFTQDMAVDITNNLDQSLIFNTVENRQDVQIKS